MIMWDGACVVHEEFKHEGLKSLMNLHKDKSISSPRVSSKRN